jgi:serine/threonine protein kinase
MHRPLSKYDVIGVLGRGGMGVVYKATDAHLERLVAIKMLNLRYADEPELLKRFYREAQSTAGFQHPNIVTVYGFGEQDGNPYLVMEYLDGESLAGILASRRSVTLAQKIGYALDACAGLSYAHARGTVHRDIKPANIMVLRNGSVKLVDFGIAHTASSTLTGSREFVGSLYYMSPEQVENKISLDERTDVFSMGVVLYELCTNELPFDGGSPPATLLKIMHEAPKPLGSYSIAYRTELEPIIFRALAKNREERYQSINALVVDLLRVYEKLNDELLSSALRQAQILQEEGNLQRAEELLQHLLKVSPINRQVFSLLRDVRQKAGEEERTEPEHIYTGPAQVRTGAAPPAFQDIIRMVEPRK